MSAEKVIAENRRLRELVRAEVALTVTAYGLTADSLQLAAGEEPPAVSCEPSAVSCEPSAEWEAQRTHAAARWGRRLWKFFG